MNHNPEGETFHFTYSAKQQDEIRKIRQKYEAPTEDKMAALRQLDAGVTRKATMRAITVGLTGALIMGTGMSLVMTSLGKFFGFPEEFSMLLGIIVGIVGLVLAGCAYPLFHHTLRALRKKIAPEILRLTDELMQ